MPTRSIVHLDADAFFASVEQAADPRLRGKPIAIGGEKRGIIASASYEARKFGIYTPMPTVQARRLCPKLILLPGDFEKYELFSRLMFSYAYDFTPEVEIGSIDEGYFDLTGTRKPPVTVAGTIRQAIRQALRLSVSEGIAANKLVSQIASKLKKPAAFEFVPVGHEAEYLSPLANKWLPGVGPKTATQLNAAGLAFVGQIAQTPIDLLGLLVGRQAPQLRSFAQGRDERPIIPARTPAKSYSEQETFAADTTDEEFLEATLRRMADQLMAKVRAEDKSIRTLTVKVRYNDMDEEQAGESLSEPTDLETDLYSKISALLRKAWRRRVSLRLVSLKLTNIYDGRFRAGLALDASARRHDAQQRLADAVDQLRQKHGQDVIRRGHDFVLLAKEGAGRKLVFEIRSPKSEVRSPTEGRNPKSEIRNPSHHIVCATRKTQDATCPPPLGSPPSDSGFRPSDFGLHSAFGLRPSDFYLPLNVHSYYSFLDSTLSILAIIELARRHELPAIALTDKNNLHGAVEFAQAAAAAGIKPILGAELNWRGHRLCLYVQNQTGYHNLCRILSREPGEESPKSETRSPQSEIQSSRFEVQSSTFAVSSSPNAPSDFGFRPSFGFRISDFGLPTDGLLAVSSSPDPAPFFPNRFYLAVTSPDALESLLHQSTNPPIHQSIASLPRVASFPIHYALPSDRWKYDVVQSIRTLTLLRQPHPEKRLDGEYHFRSAAEMQRLFAAHPDLLAHSFEIADRCDFAFTLGKPQFPRFTPPDGSAPAAFLRRLVLEGLQRRYPKDHARLKPQLEEELAIIREVGYEEYFLVVWDILQECR
ncbi:MAG TPA: PHP domain-containing protein, partial [Tepidisphaeraceae bacterium]|nr:PHP domain-containing protein [Tepidisphaeraceae bacterium]